ncbi:DUF4126 domain-containing protein [Magnetospira sp. QH-2]|uniref:DUF4126 domain-containing protein n=1 Tax=Magnetospira sp. (strain QH-2) TaxID=1288970 RepID=UPI0003E80F2F|nr:DUF4126 domain-containing protein [Magnetospira sp. QH-2]CCQ73254.1 Conserved membrane protein of unknown function [Magnetospira sp. QH-2]
MGILETILLALGAAWGSGINLYGTALILGGLDHFGLISLPVALEVLSDPTVLGLALTLYLIEFVADKVPGLDSLWDIVHTFIRIPAGALLAAGAIQGLDDGSLGGALGIGSAFFGGALVASLSHFLKAGTRAFANMSPEPFSNWGLSMLEDIALVIGLVLMVMLPVVFLVIIAMTLASAIFLLPRMWKGLIWLLKPSGEKNKLAAPEDKMKPVSLFPTGPDASL